MALKIRIPLRFCVLNIYLHHKYCTPSKSTPAFKHRMPRKNIAHTSAIGPMNGQLLCAYPVEGSTGWGP